LSSGLLLIHADLGSADNARVGVADAVPESTSRLCRRPPDVLRPRTFWSFADVELDAVTLTQILKPLAVHRALVEKVFLRGIVLDEPKALVDS
jgi:hypothetical protein